MASSVKVEIYTWAGCPYCERAKTLLRRKSVDYVEYCLDGDEPGREKMTQRAGGRRSVPQIFVAGVHVGGSDELHALDRAGKLDSMLHP